MTTFRCEALLLAAVLFLGACGQSAPDAARDDTSLTQPKNKEEILRVVQIRDPRAIERELPRLLAKIRASNGSIGTELVNAGFAPAPALPEKYGYERADGTSIGVALRGAQIEVRVNQEPPK